MLALGWRRLGKLNDLEKSYLKTPLLFLKLKKINIESSHFSFLPLRLNECQTLQEYLAEIVHYDVFW